MTVPPAIRLGQQCIRSPSKRTETYKWCTLVFTFFIYCSYHLSRKPISVVKSILNPTNCSKVIHNGTVASQNTLVFIDNTTIHCGWKPFDDADGNKLLGFMDIGFLFPYAIGMFISGHIAERVSLRYFLTCGMILSGVTTAMFGFGYYLNIHNVYFYLMMQVLGGFVQSTGWPSVVTCVANWFGKGKRGLIMGLWNSHTSFGNIIGSVVAGAFADTNWGLSFIVPGAIICGLGILVFLFLVPTPEDVDCDPPDHAAHPAGMEAVSTDEEATDSNNSVQQEVSPLLTQVLPPTAHQGEPHAISFMGALKIPGVIEFALCLFFAKLVSYVFLYWLPDYIHGTTSYNAEMSADLSTVFDFGGILGGVIAGVVSDVTGMRASTCMLMLIFAGPMLFIYEFFGSISLPLNIFLLLILGFFVNGPYALITTAVSADLGTHHSLMGNAKALATVTAIIDGTGSLGAAVGPLLAGLFKTWNPMFYMLMSANFIAMLMLIRLVWKELRPLCR